MRRLPHRAEVALRFLGVDTARMHSVIAGMPRFAGDVAAYVRARGDERFPLRLRSIFPMLGEAGGDAGTARGAYFQQDLWAARKIFERRPARHVDVGSRVDGFVAHVLVFMPVEVIDIRQLTSAVRGLTFTQADATNLEQLASGRLGILRTFAHVKLLVGRVGEPSDA